MISLLITGGTGTFGNAFVRHALNEPQRYRRLVIFSRDEQKQEAMARELAPLDNAGILRFFIGDVRDESRLRMAMRDVDTVIHAAALKIVPKCEYDPIEAVKTNVQGSQNVITAAMDCRVKRIVALSTDKAVSPVNLYGATKLTMERLFTAANHLSGSEGNWNAPRFAVVRYGNVANSRGSVVPLFKQQQFHGRPLTLTHPDMTRFWINAPDAVAMVLTALRDMVGGEIFVPRMPSFRVADLAEAICSDCQFKIIGVRPGEKIHESLMIDQSGVVSFPDYHVISPDWLKPSLNDPATVTYTSDTNHNWLTVDDLRRLINVNA